MSPAPRFNQLFEPERVIPRHVAACEHSPDRKERWFIWTWKREGSTTQIRIPYQCNSWRCETCRRHEAAVTFARIKEATAPLDPSGWVFGVLTLDRDGYYSGRPWSDVNDAYRSLGKMQSKLMRSIGRIYGPETRTVVSRNRKTGTVRTREVRVLGNRWVSVVEAHRSGWPHMNVLFWCPELAAELRRENAETLDDPEIADAVELARDAWLSGEPIPARVRETARKATIAKGALRDLLVESGWGLQSTAEAARSSDAIAGYVVKLAGKHDASTGELAKITQAPLNAPARFRRLRAGKCFLPPRHHNPAITGCLVRHRQPGEVWKHGPLHVVNPPKDPAQNEPTLRAMRAELDVIREEQTRALFGGSAAMPPFRIAVAGKLESRKVAGERWVAMQQWKGRGREHDDTS